MIFVLFIISNLFCGSRTGAVNNNVQISSVFEAFGYSPACVSSALTTCEFSSKKNFSIDIADSFDVILSLLQEMKTQRENCQSEIKSLLQETKLERENEKKNIDALWERLENVTKTLLNMEILLQEVTSDRSGTENCASTVDNSTNIGTSAVEIQDSLTTINSSEEEKPKKKYRRNCAELRQDGDKTSGVRSVNPEGVFNTKPVDVYCDQVADGGGWTLIQNRDVLPVRENFNRPWQEYVEGFGDLNGEFWLGLQNIHFLTNFALMELRVDLEDWEGEKRWAKYAIFHVGDALSKYVLIFGNYSGDAGDGMNYPLLEDWSLNGMKFSTHDQDNDRSVSNCAKDNRGGWWFNECGLSHLNGYQLKGEVRHSFGEGINWYTFRGPYYSLKKASMKIRPFFRKF